MKQLLSKTRMLEEAASKNKGFSWGKEIGIFLLVFFVAQTVSAIPVTVATVLWIFTSEAFFNSVNDLASNGDVSAYVTNVEEMLTSIPDWLMLVQLFATAITIIVTLLFCRWFEKRNMASLGLRRGHILREYLVGAAVGIALISACVGLCTLAGGIKLSVTEFSLPVWILYLLGFLIQGASEEILCRGYMMVSVSRKNALWLAVMTNSVLFALLHIFNPGIGILPLINIALFGVLESVYVLKRGNLWGACAIHSLWNFFQGNVFGISVSGTGTGASPLSATLTDSAKWLNGGSFGIEGSIIVTIVVALVTGLLLLMPTNREEIA